MAFYYCLGSWLWSQRLWMAWWGQRPVAADPAEHARHLERLVRQIGAAGDARTTYDALHQLVDRTPVHDVRVALRLVDMLEHPALEDESRRAISIALERLFQHNDTAFGKLISLLGHRKGSIRNVASDLLSKMVFLAPAEKQAACVRAISRRLDALDDSTRSATVACIHDIAAMDKRLCSLCVEALCSQVRSPRSFSRKSAVDGLVGLAGLGRRADLIRAVVACLEDPSDQVRACAANAVGALGAADPGSHQSWIVAAAGCMDHKDGHIRTAGRAALEALSRGPPSRANSAARSCHGLMLCDPLDLAYGKPGQPCIVDDHLLLRPPPPIGVNAQSNNSRAAVAHVGDRLEDPNPSVRDSAVISLCALRDSGEYARMDLIRCSALRLEFDNNDVRSAAVEALAQLVRGDVPEEVEAILEVLEKDLSPNYTRVYAIQALGKVAKRDDERVVKALLHSSADPDFRVIREALHVLNQKAHFGANTPGLDGALAHPNPQMNLQN